MILLGITPIMGIMAGIEYVEDEDGPDKWIVIDLFIIRFTFTIQRL